MSYIIYLQILEQTDTYYPKEYTIIGNDNIWIRKNTIIMFGIKVVDRTIIVARNVVTKDV